MLSKQKRLNLKKDFKWMVAGKQINTQFARIYIKIGDNEFPKIGIATSSKNFKKATERSRAKRTISAALEVLYENLPQNINIMALPKVSILGVKSGDVALDLEEVLQNEKVIS